MQKRCHRKRKTEKDERLWIEKIGEKLLKVLLLTKGKKNACK